MSRSKCAAAGFPALLARGLGVAAVLAAAGCSADVTRFSFLGSDVASAPAPSPVAYAPPPRGYPAGPRWDGFGLQETALPPASSPQHYRGPGPHYQPAPAAELPPRADRWAKGADRDPPPWTDRDPPPWTDRDPAPWMEGQGAKWKHGPAGERPPGWQGRYAVQSGDTLPAIARRHKVSVDELKRANGISDSGKVWAGKVLAVPARSGAAAPASPPRVVQVTPRIIGPQGKAASEPAPRTPKGEATTEAAPAPAAATGKFRWPVRGRVISGFGPQPDGSKNEGINLAVPLGTEIHAAEAGRVHYAGDGLKGYGNLILIRHDNGWVSAYAHSDQMLVKAGDQVKRGQVIGKAGKSGPVAQPQLRFELRQGSVPVDPLPHLAN